MRHWGKNNLVTYILHGEVKGHFPWLNLSINPFNKSKETVVIGPRRDSMGLCIIFIFYSTMLLLDITERT